MRITVTPFYHRGEFSPRHVTAFSNAAYSFSALPIYRYIMTDQFNLHDEFMLQFPKKKTKPRTGGSFIAISATSNDGRIAP
jgi:hypothetical protein